MGPTASGKTAASICIAQEIGCEIISVDSALVYRGMDIGTAKPDETERQGIPHHLIDIIEPNDVFSAGAFRDRALSLIQEIQERGKIPLLAGGTMLYFNTLFNGLARLPSANPEVRAEIEAEAQQKGWKFMHALLHSFDPESAGRIHPNDPQRIQRAIEVYRVSGKTLTQFRSESVDETLPFSQIKMVITPKERSTLHQKISDRFHLMLEQGFMAEVEQLLIRGDLKPDMPSMRTVGYRQAWQYLRGEMDYQEMVERAIIATRQLAKRQYTWLRKQEDAGYYFSDDKNMLSLMLSELKSRLNS